MTALEAAEAVLRDASGPLTAKQITEQALSRGLWETRGKTPEQTMASLLAVDIRDRAAESRFRRAAPGQFELNPDRGIPVGRGAPSSATSRPRQPRSRAQARMSFLDAAEDVLRRSPGQAPMHYRQITEQALAEGLIASAGRTPDATMRAQIGVENRRREARGDRPRFNEAGRGLIGLSEWQQAGVLREIERHNEERRAELLERVKAGSARGFEQLIAELLSAQGFEIVSVTPFGGDQGVDVRAEQMVGGMVRTKVAVQAKKWGANVQAPTVRELRGSLSPHERGVIVTTSDFGRGARNEAERPDAVPIALINGQELISLMIENELGVRRSAHDVVELAGSLPGDDGRIDADD